MVFTTAKQYDTYLRNAIFHVYISFMEGIFVLNIEIAVCKECASNDIHKNIHISLCFGIFMCYTLFSQGSFLWKQHDIFLSDNIIYSLFRYKLWMEWNHILNSVLWSLTKEILWNKKIAAKLGYKSEALWQFKTCE